MRTRISIGVILATMLASFAFSFAAKSEEPATQPTTQPGQEKQIIFVKVKHGKPNGTASVTVKAWPNAKCSIVYHTPSGVVSHASGLQDENTDADGKVTWTWNIGRTTKTGTGSVTVTCEGQSATSEIKIMDFP